MKKINSLILAAGLLAPMLAHAGCETVLPRWAEQLQPGRAFDAERSVCKEWPADPKLTLAAITFPDGGESAGRYDLDVLVADSASGQIIAHAHQEGGISHADAQFSDIAIDTARYRIADDARAFGVRVSYEGASRVAPSGTTTLNLYTLNGLALRPVLDRLVVAQASGEWDQRCAGSYDATTRTIDMGARGSNGVSSLNVSEKKIHTVTKMVKGECVGVNGKPQRASATLGYRDGQYAVPKGMRHDG